MHTWTERGEEERGENGEVIELVKGERERER